MMALTKFGVCPYSAGMFADNTLNSCSASTLGCTFVPPCSYSVISYAVFCLKKKKQLNICSRSRDRWSRRDSRICDRRSFPGRIGWLHFLCLRRQTLAGELVYHLYFEPLP